MNPVLDRRTVAFDMNDVHINYCRDRRGSNLSQEQTREEDGIDASGTPNDVRLFPKVNQSPSKSIPISNIKRSPSEVQLQEDEVMAEYRDFCMYARIVNGIHEGRRRHHRNRVTSQNDELENIKKTRSSPITEIPPSFQEDFNNRIRTNATQDFHQSWPLLKTGETDNRFGLAPRLEDYDQSNLIPSYLASSMPNLSTADLEEDGIFTLDM